MIKGSPSIRRKMMNSALCQVDREYTESLYSFKKLISERNAALKGIRSGKTIGGQVFVDTLDEAIAPVAGIIMERRSRLIESLSKRSASIYNEMTNGRGGDLSLIYKPTINVEDKGEGEIAEEYYKLLSARRKRDLDGGETVLGPHRDDVLIAKGNEEMARFGSWGQARAASLASLLAASDLLFSGSKTRVSLLLDDCFAELDSENTDRFVEIASRYGQVFLASPRIMECDSLKSGARFVFDDIGKIRRES